MRSVTRTIREILLTEYIGAILVALLVVDALSTLITLVVKQISLSFYASGHDAAIINAHRMSFTYSLLEAATQIGISLALAYLIARWLYPSKPARSD